MMYCVNKQSLIIAYINLIDLFNESMLNVFTDLIVPEIINIYRFMLLA